LGIDGLNEAINSLFPICMVPKGKKIDENLAYSIFLMESKSSIAPKTTSTLLYEIINQCVGVSFSFYQIQGVSLNIGKCMTTLFEDQ